MSAPKTQSRDGRTAVIALYVTEAVKAELEAEAREHDRKLSDYVRHVVERRTKVKVFERTKGE
jgi:hypothetical protein